MTTQLPQVTRTYQNHTLDSTTWTQESARQLIFCGHAVPERTDVSQTL